MGNTVSGKHLNIDLDFNANTSKAQKDVQDLQNKIDSLLTSLSKSSGEFGEGLGKATKAAIELKQHLKDATNIQTGKLDLSALHKSLQAAGQDLTYFRKNLSAAGPEGKAAFSAFADSVLRAEVPLKRTSALLQEFGTTLKNTARWQISSSVLHGFMGSIQTAYHYAEDLNKSLNNIRIVTGQNTDQMAAFAKQANESAKALSTTTTKYTDAALIYYQQGLSDKEVKERTDVTVKMANVARESAEEVSNQMTAVWNNFNKDSSESVESFADKMTALGAATASSTSEIAEGLSKFAGIADTIGLSFDYATSALATVTATSRESADVVGTAFKTIFARMEGLKQGKTDEDGTDLNKYSQGLAKIGVQIKDQSGALKNMDEILDDMGDRWQSLSRDQKIATAQTVAGVRQYNQLMTLMDNWDFFQKNLATAQDSEGTLQKQADTYAESWEAARDRVTAAAEEIYSQLLNDDFFIDLNNGFAGFLGLISDTIEGLGGLKGVLSGIGLLVTNVFGKQIMDSLSNFFSTSKQRMENWKKTQDSMITEKTAMAVEEGYENTAGAYEQLNQLNQSLIDNQDKMTEAQKEQAKAELEVYKTRIKNLEALEQEVALKEKELAAKKGKQQDKIEALDRVTTRKETFKQSQIGFGGVDPQKIEEVEGKYKEFLATHKTITETVRNSSAEFKNFQTELGLTGDAAKTYAEILEQEAAAQREADIATEGVLTLAEELDNKMIDLSDAAQDATTEMERLNEQFENPKASPKKFGDNVLAIGKALMSVTMTISALQGLGDIWTDDSISTGEKMLSSLTSIGMVIPGIISGVEALQTVFTGLSTIAAAGLFAGITAGALLLTAGITALIDAWNADANAAKKAAEAAEGLKQEYEDLKTANEDLKASFDDYNSARAALKEMTVGTVEWKEAVVELNEKVLDLINKYPQLAGEVQNVNGVLEMSSQAQQNLLDQQAKRLEQSQQAMMAGQIYANQTAETSKYTDYEREHNLTVDERMNKAGMPTFGNNPGGSLKQFDSSDFKAALENVVNAYEQNGAAIFKDTAELVKATGINEKLANALMENSTELQSMTEELSTNREQTNLLSEQISSKLLDGKAESLGVSNEEGFSKRLGLEYQDEIEKQMKAYEDNGIWGGPNDEKVQKEYAEAMGYKWVSNDSDDKGTYVVNGEEKQISDAIAREFLAIQKAEQELGGDLKDLAEKFNQAAAAAKKMANGSEEVGNNLVGFLNGTLNIGDLTQKQAEELSKMSEKITDESQLSDQQLKDMGIDEEDIDREAWQKQLESLPDQIDFSRFTDGMAATTKEAYDNIISEHGSDLTQNGAKTISGILNSAFEKGDLDTVANVEKAFEKADASGKAQEFADALGEIPWDSTEVDDFKTQMQNLGINTGMTDEEIQGLIDSMVAGGQAAQTTAEQYAEIHKILDSLEDGGVVSDEDFAKLEGITDATDQYFTTMLDGTHKLTGDAEEFYKLVQNNLIDEASEKIEKLQNKNYAANAVKDYDIDALSKVQNKGVAGAPSSSGAFVADEENIQKQIQLYQALGDDSEETAAKIRKFQDLLNNHAFKAEDAKELADIVGTLKGNFETLNDTIAKNNEEIQQQYNAIALSATSMKDLQTMLEEGKINTDAFNLAFKQMKDQLDEDVDKEEFKELSEYVQKAGSNIDGLSDEIKDNEEAAKDVTEALLRYDSALESVQSNMDNWKELLKSDDLQDQAKAAKELGNAYGDLLDLDGSQLSNEFLTSTENLKLMEEAAKGSEDAYNKLMEAAQQDIEGQCHISVDDTEFWNAKTEVESAMDEMNFSDIEVGATLNDENFLNELTNMVNSAGMTAEQATSYLASMGIDAEVETQSKQEPVKRTVNDMVPETEYNTVDIPVVAADGNVTTNPVTVPYIRYKAVPHEMTDINAGGGFSLKVKSANKSSGGGFKFKNSSHGAGSAGRAARKGSGGGGKKGGGGGKKGQKIQPKQYQDEFDIYGELNHSIKDLDNTLSKLGKAYDYAFGKDRLDNLEKQNKAIREQAAYVKKLADAEKKEQKKIVGKRVKNKKGKTIKKTGLTKYGGKFDKDGELLNYTEMTKKEWKKWEAARKKYNKSGRTDKDKKKFDKADKRYEKFKKLLDRYENVHQKMQEDQEKAAELIRQAVENNFERWKFKLEMDLDTRKAQRTWKSFLTKMHASVKDFGKEFSVTSVAKVNRNLANFNSQKEDLNALMKKRQQLKAISTKDGWKEYTKKVKDPTQRIVSSAAEAKEKMKELDEQIMQTAEDMESQLGEAWQTYIDYLNQIQEKYDLINERLQRQGDILAYNKELIELQYGDEAYTQMSAYYDAEMKFLQQKASDYKLEEAGWKAQFDAAVEAAKARGQAVDVNNVQTWTEDMVLAYKNMTAAAGNLEQTQLEIVKTSQEIYKNKVDNAILEAQQKMYNGQSFEEYRENWERAKEVQDRYLDKTEKLYHIQTLMNKIDQSIASTKNLKNAEKLKKLRDEELKKLSKEEKLTKYMVDAANARYEIALKEMALEEARNNKNSMKLTRNQEGNWSYQYVADMDEVLKKQQDLRDAEYNLYSLAKNEERNQEEESMKAMERYWEKTREAAYLCMTNQTKGQEKLNKALKEFNEDLKFTGGQLKEVGTDLRTSGTALAVHGYQQNPNDVEQISPEQAEVGKEVTSVFGKDIDFQGICELLGTYGDEAKAAFLAPFIGAEGSTGIFDDITSKIQSTFTTGDTSFVEIVKSVPTLLGDDMGGVTGYFTKLYDVIDPSKEGGALYNYKTVVSDYFKEIGTQIGNASLAVGTYQGAVQKVNNKAEKDTEKILKSITDLYDAWNKIAKKDGVLDKYRKKVGKLPKTKTITIKVKYKEIGKPSSLKGEKDSGNDGGGGGGSKTGNNNKGGGKVTKKTSKWKITDSSGKKTYASGYTTEKKAKSARDKNISKWKKTKVYTNSGQYKYKNDSPEAAAEYRKWLNSKIAKYKTGGYTGDWSSTKGLDRDGGKLGLLHQKELILNKEDTKNMLAAINVIRDIKSLNSSITNTISESIASLFANSVKNLIGNRIPEKQKEEKSITIENINAEFPNAQNVDDIREAIMSLPRLASQYVSRNLK